MDQDAFSGSLFKWDPRGTMPPPPRFFDPVFSVPPPPNPYPIRDSLLGGLEDLFQAYGVRYFTASKIAELGFTVSTLLVMKEEEIDEMVSSLSQFYRWEILVGERYGIKAAVRAEKRRIEEEEARRRHLSDAANALDALSQEGLSEEPVQQEREVVGSGGGVVWEVPRGSTKKKQSRKNGHSQTASLDDDDGTYNAVEEDEIIKGSDQRQREHPFIVTEPGEVARGKKNGLDYLFHLYEQCREFLIQVQNLAKDRGEKCPTKVTNQVFRYAKKAGASYINKPKMRHYVHCYALHCLDEEISNALRRAFKERGENVGAWRQACYKPLVSIAARQGWDIDVIFNAHPRLTIWYVPTKLRQLCHAQRSGAACSSSIPGGHDCF